MPFEAVAAATSNHDTWKRLAEESADAGAVQRIVERWVSWDGAQRSVTHTAQLFAGGYFMKRKGKRLVREKTVAAAAAGAQAGIEKARLRTDMRQQTDRVTVMTKVLLVRPGMFEATEAEREGSGRVKPGTGEGCCICIFQIVFSVFAVLFYTTFVLNVDVSS